MNEDHPENSADTIVVKYDSWSQQWVVHFAPKSDEAFSGYMPIAAMRRLLEATEAEPAAYPVLCDQDLSGLGMLDRTVIWDPPELLFPCPDCHGCGEYVGLLERETCRGCGGRTLVPV